MQTKSAQTVTVLIMLSVEAAAGFHEGPAACSGFHAATSIIYEGLPETSMLPNWGSAVKSSNFDLIDVASSCILYYF